MKSFDIGDLQDSAVVGLINAMEEMCWEIELLDFSIQVLGPHIIEESGFWTNVWTKILDLRNCGNEVRSLLDRKRDLCEMYSEEQHSSPSSLQRSYRHEIMPRAEELALHYNKLTRYLKQYSEDAKTGGKCKLPSWIEGTQPERR